MVCKLSILILTICVFNLIGCANLQTIERRTWLPQSTSHHGVAIHLDAQQRLVMVKAIGDFCAEPSPDALAAYASALGLGISVPGQGAGSLAQALSSSAGSIGLRTQSITLMRDALYRTCESYLNGAIGPIQVATLLRRSQDLTAGILAVEQLTGAIAANQVILTNTAGAGASASLLSNQQLLDAARKDEEAKAKGLEDAKKQRDAAKKAADDKRVEWTAADTTYKQAVANSTGTDEDRAKLKADADNKKNDLNRLKNDLAAAENQVKTNEALLAEAKKTRETIENIKDSALTSAIANTAGAGQFNSSIAQRKELSKEATESIASAVQGIVQTVLSKEYTHDSCMDLLTYIPRNYNNWDSGQKEGYAQVRELCIALLSNVISKMLTATFTADAATARIEQALSTDLTLRRRLNKWIASNGLNISSTTLIYGREYTNERQRAIDALSIP